MGYIDFNGNPVEINTGSSSVDTSGLFDISKILLKKGEKHLCKNGVYSVNPWRSGGSIQNNNRIFVEFAIYGSENNKLYSNRVTSGWIYKVDGLDVYAKLLSKVEDYYDSGFNFNSADKVATLTEEPQYITYGISGDSGAVFSDLEMAYNVVSDVKVSADLEEVKYITKNRQGFLEQIHDTVNEKNIVSLDSFEDERTRRLRTEAIRQINQLRHAIRIATFNVRGSGGFGQKNWYKLKECLQNYGIDICGMQEVSYPLGNDPSYTKVLSEYFNSWQFNSFSDVGYLYGKNNRSVMCGNGCEIVSSDETYLSAQSPSGDYRYVVKCEITLPRFMDKRGSENLKLSVYNTQLEVINNNIAQSQAREILAMAQADPNPFVIIMGDTNDFTITKEVWEIFEDGGFEGVANTNTSTVGGTWDFNCIDNFFLSNRVKSLDWDVVFAQDYPWRESEMLSDHDLVLADVTFDYSDIRCLNFKMDEGITATVSNGKNWMTDKETVTVTFNGATSLTCYDCMIQPSQGATAFTISGNTVTIDGSKLIGDVYIRAT